MNTQRVFGLFVAATMAATMIAVPFGTSAHAAQGLEDFDPNNLISDEAMYGAVSQSMSEEDISAFLADKGKRCVRGKDGSACIKDARFNTQSFPASQWCPEPYQGADNESAAAVIAKSARACQISPKVLLVLLQKEQGLIQTTNPTKRAFDRATGFACPDTAPCDPSKAGFATQVYAAASRLQQYKAQPHRFNFAVGRTTRIGYHPNASCGFTTVTPKTAATAALYNYTPYVPNAAALANPYGSGDSCSAYGNRNFFRIHSDWFGRPNEATVTEEPTPTPQPQPTPQPAPQPSPEPKANPGGIVLATKVKLQPNDVNADGNADFFTPLNSVAPNGFGWGNGEEMAVAEFSLKETLKSAPHRVIGIGWNPYRTIDVADWDGDGYSDLMLIHPNGLLSLYPGSDDFRWKAPRIIGNGWGGMDMVVGGTDFDGDTRVDLLARVARSGDLYLYRGNGRGGFLTPHRVGWGWKSFSHFAFIPSWKDGHPALAAVNADSGRLHVYSTNGRGGWGQRYDLGYGWNAFRSISGTRDVTGDGRGDLLTITKDGVFRIYATIGNSFGIVHTQSTEVSAARVFPAGNQYVEYRFVLGEDGKIYTVHKDAQPTRAQAGAKPIGIYANQDEKLFNVGDWNGDGLNDIIKWNSSNDMILHAGTGKGRWDTSGYRIGNGWAFNEVLVANGWAQDAPRALLAWRKKTGTLMLYTADSRGQWGNVHEVGSGLTWADTIVDAGNWSGDGRPQIFAREAGSGRLMWIGSDSSGFRVDQALPIGNGWNNISDFYATSDLNGDGLSDVVARHPNGTLSLYTGAGRLGFGSVRPLHIK